MNRFLITILFFCTALVISAQDKTIPGILTGNVMDSRNKALEGATVRLLSFTDTLAKRTVLTGKDGQFSFTGIPFGYYKLSFSYVGLQPLVIDSIHFRMERFDFNLPDIILKPKSDELLEEVLIYAEKPLIQSKDGNITFNAGESALAAGSNASELLTQVPLVTRDPDGKVSVRGKEPRILIDDKPVELNMQQLQDLLESLPGSSIEKIEVMTNPPPQYANEQGGVINIVTRKGRVGKSGRLSVSGGTRGEASVNGSFNYRKQGFAFSINAGAGYNRYLGNGYSVRNNLYADSSNFFNTTSGYTNKNLRPNFRFNLDYDFSKHHLLNLVLHYNQNNFDNYNTTEYRNINRFDELWKLSEREIQSTGTAYNPNTSLTYTWKGKPGETLRFISSYQFSRNENNRDFYQQFFYPDFSPTGVDSMQRQDNLTRVNGHTFRVNYDKMLGNAKTFISVGSLYNRSNNEVLTEASYKKKPEGTMERLDLLSNHFRFHQTVSNLRASVKQVLGENFSFTAGATAERTGIWFELLKENREVKNDYLTWLPFANINKTWKEKLSLTLAYRRSIRRPGIGELNPTIDFSDPYNIRFGNAGLEASTAHNFDFIIGRTRTKYFLNLGIGFNQVQDIFSQVRTLLGDGKTQVTWENISDRREYEVSSWNGITLSQKLRVNFSTSYTYTRYSAFDKTVRNFRDGGSFTSNLNFNFNPTDRWSFNGGFNLNRFASPQGYARWNTSMNLGIQRKFLDKRLIITVNTIDPFVNQQRKIFTYGTHFNLESFSLTRTRNYRLTLAYNFNNQLRKKPVLLPGKISK
ncbi:MAG: outer membrane beta-barrel protein [Sphingobacteriales bacterium]|nr:outer membrane beta-barrel protein [Sphingobacteriales bacterium]